MSWWFLFWAVFCGGVVGFFVFCFFVFCLLFVCFFHKSWKFVVYPSSLLYKHKIWYWKKRGRRSPQKQFNDVADLTFPSWTLWGSPATSSYALTIISNAFIPWGKKIAYVPAYCFGFVVVLRGSLLGFVLLFCWFLVLAFCCCCCFLGCCFL